MSKAYEMIMESLEEIISDMEKTGGKNLKCETLSAEVSAPKNGKSFSKIKPARSYKKI